MKKYIVLFLCLCCSFFVFGCQKIDNVDELSQGLSTYLLNLTFDDSEMSISATQTFNYINDTDCILKELKFHLYPKFFTEGHTEAIVSSTELNNAYPNGINYADFNMTRVKVDNVDINAIFEGTAEDILVITLSSSLMPNDTVEIYFEYNFTLPNCCHRFGYGNNTINLNNFYPILCVYENGEYSTNPYNANGDPFYSNMANYEISLSAPKEYVIASSGIQSQITNQNSTITTIECKLVRDISIVMSKDFQVSSQNIDNLSINYYYTSNDFKDEALACAVDAINTFSSLFGHFPYSTFSVVQADFLYGGMEYPNLIMVSNSIDNLDDYLNVIIHETAHQWWYAMVGNDEYNEPWLDESLTEFSTLLFYDYNENYSFTHNEMYNTAKENYSLFVTVYTDVLGDLDTSMRAVDAYATEPEYTYCIYIKGVLMYESLYELIGENEFVEALKIYFNENKYKNSTFQNLISAFESATKNQLENFFSSWLNGKVVVR